MTTKTCAECKQDLPLPSFSKNKSRKDGLAIYCRPCTAIKRKKQPSRIKSEEEVVSISFTCKAPGCTRPTRDVPIHRDDIKKMSNRFYCEPCNAKISSETELFDGISCGPLEVEDILASELPLIDSTGG